MTIAESFGRIGMGAMNDDARYRSGATDSLAATLRAGFLPCYRILAAKACGHCKPPDAVNIVLIGSSIR